MQQKPSIVLNMFAAVHFFNRLMSFVWDDSLRRVPNKSEPGAVLLG